MYIPIDLAWIEAVMLASVRMVAFVIIAPPFSFKAFPGTVKGIIGVGLGVAVAPRVTDGFEVMDDWEFLLAVVSEATIGAALGFLVYLIFSAIQATGDLIDMFGGFQVASGFDPKLNTNGAQFSRLFGMAAIALMFTTGAYQVVFGGLFRTFDAVPVGGMLNLPATAEQLVKSLSGMFVGSIQVAGPLLIVLFLADLGLGLLTRVAPALQAFSMSFPVKIGLTLILGVLVFTALPAFVTSLTTAIAEAFGAVTSP
ncbi:flagellar biosynthetic protein FliR [Leifsonia sp. Leaf264]|uniref:flagellar biosynthetic protein FliR n=1 Tax=Leifsonia sp. Leaf264 TaxID=1736314 RepID=UPI0006FA93CD|nr:flagellar biosynthetic protein FliR [Leifsonia sp. Leaf264]KQO98248.1 flagellar biosynthetic protein FliR [Leifsonia sp. Leaf264]